MSGEEDGGRQGRRGAQTSGLEMQLEVFLPCPWLSVGPRRRAGATVGGLNARAVGAVAVGAPVGGLSAALARDPAPHLHSDSCLRAPPDVAAQLLGRPFCDAPKHREGTRSDHRRAARSHPLGKGHDGRTVTGGGAMR